MGEAADSVVIGPWAQTNRALVPRAVDRGEIPPVRDLETLARVVPTMAAYRVSIERRRIPNDYIASLLDTVLLPASDSLPATAADQGSIEPFAAASSSARIGTAVVTAWSPSRLESSITSSTCSGVAPWFSALRMCSFVPGT